MEKEGGHVWKRRVDTLVHPYDRSNSDKFFSACSYELPQTSRSGLKSLQTCGRSGWSYILHSRLHERWMQYSPAAFPSGRPGIGEEIEIAIQQAPQPVRHSIIRLFAYFSSLTAVP